MSEEESETTEKTARISPKPIGEEFGYALIEHINSKAVLPDDACQVCGSPNNTVQGQVYHLPVAPADGALVSGQAMPVAVTICYNCGFVRLFSVNIVKQLLDGVVFPIGGPSEPGETDAG